MSKNGQLLESIIKDMVRQVLQSPDDDIKTALISGLGIIGSINIAVNEKMDLLKDQISAYRDENIALRELVDEERKNSQIILEESRRIIHSIKDDMIRENERLKKFLAGEQDKLKEFKKSERPIYNEHIEAEFFCSNARTCPFIIEEIKVGGKCVRKNCVNRNS